MHPVVALLLGWGLGSEPLTPRSIGAAVLILGSMVLVTLERRVPT